MQKTSEWLQSFTSKEAAQQIINDKNLKSIRKTGAIKISVTGGKGGVGKTSIALKMAKELSFKNYRVLVVDCDYNLANTAIKLGIPLDNTFFSLLSAEKTFDECLYKDGNFHLLSACNGSLDLFESKLNLEEIILDIINEHQFNYDFILLDCPAGINKETLVLNAYSDQRFIVVTPDKSSITDSYSLAKILSTRFGIKENHLLVNMYNTKKQYERVVKTMSETIENFLGCRTQILGGIPRLDVKNCEFDKNFLFNRQNVSHQEFCKVINRYTEQMSRTMSGQDCTISLNAGFEQEVH
jgi:flagellar biosynthesis protein FlhG